MDLLLLYTVKQEGGCNVFLVLFRENNYPVQTFFKNIDLTERVIFKPKCLFSAKYETLLCLYWRYIPESMTCKPYFFSFLFFFFFFCSHICGMWKSQGQASNPHHNSDPSHCSDNTGSLTCCPTRELLQTTLSLTPPYILFGEGKGRKGGLSGRTPLKCQFYIYCI